MPGGGKRGKPKTRFPFVSHRPWKSLRDSHIPTTRTTILPFPNQNQKTRKEPQLRKKPQPPSSGSSFDEKMLRSLCHEAIEMSPLAGQ